MSSSVGVINMVSTARGGRGGGGSGGGRSGGNTSGGGGSNNTGGGNGGTTNPGGQTGVDDVPVATPVPNANPDLPEGQVVGVGPPNNNRPGPDNGAGSEQPNLPGQQTPNQNNNGVAPPQDTQTGPRPSAPNNGPDPVPTTKPQDPDAKIEPDRPPTKEELANPDLDPANFPPSEETWNDWFAKWGDDILIVAGLAFVGLDLAEQFDDDGNPIPPSEDSENPESGGVCLRMPMPMIHPDHPLPQTTQIGAATDPVPDGAPSSAPMSDTNAHPHPQKLNPLPNDGFTWFRTAAGECRKWSHAEQALIKKALAKRKAMREAYLRKNGCRAPKRVCRTYPAYRRRYCHC